MIRLTKHKYSPELKEKVVKEALETGNNSLVARRHDMAKHLVGDWVRAYKKKSNLNLSVKTNSSLPNNSLTPAELSEAQENEKLKKILGEKDLEIAILKDLLKKTNPHLKIK